MLIKMGKTALYPLMLLACLSGIVYAGSPHFLGVKKVTLDASTDTVAAGYYAATTLHAVDTDLAVGNIKKDVAIFGVTGTYTSDANPALAGDILTGKNAYVNGAMVTGNVPVGGYVIGASLSMPIPNGLYSGNKTATTASDAFLVPGNILSNVTIFNVTGTYNAIQPHELPDTGQTLCYDPSGSTTGTITCPAADADNAQDGSRSGTQPSYTPAPIGSDYVVTDNLTGLMWKKCSEGQTASVSNCTGTPGTYTFAAALTRCGAQTYAGFSDWRLPNIRELFSIINDNTFTAPLIDKVKFPVTVSDAYWSSTTYAGDASTAIYVSFDYPTVMNSPKTTSHYVRCVRGP